MRCHRSSSTTIQRHTTIHYSPPPTPRARLYCTKSPRAFVTLVCDAPQPSRGWIVMRVVWCDDDDGGSSSSCSFQVLYIPTNWCWLAYLSSPPSSIHTIASCASLLLLVAHTTIITVIGEPTNQPPVLALNQSLRWPAALLAATATTETYIHMFVRMRRATNSEKRRDTQNQFRDRI